MIDENKQAVLLLTSHFTSPKKGDLGPLTQIEYGRFAHWLHSQAFKPSDLFHRFDDVSRQWRDPKGKITVERLRFLLGRGLAMGVALERWQSAGIWVISRAESIYPSRLKKRLGQSSPAILYGVGNPQLLNAGGIAIVGSRNVDERDEAYTRMIAGQAAAEGLNVVSGGARGVDETAMLGSLEVEGTAVGVVANDLFKSALSKKWRSYIKANQLALVSPFYPEARFHVGSAMGRNKYIYCLADFGLVVRSEEDKGGTWTGAKECLKSSWVPVFVKEGSDATGNSALLKLGAASLAAPAAGSDVDHDWLLKNLVGAPLPAGDEERIETVEDESKAAPDLLPVVSGEASTELSVGEIETEIEAESPSEDVQVESLAPEINEVRETSAAVMSTDDTADVAIEEDLEPTAIPEVAEVAQPPSDYESLILTLKALFDKQDAVTLAELKLVCKGSTQKKIIEWLDRAALENIIVRKGRLRTYLLSGAGQETADLFS
ncbi:DNA-processing protein DprA [Pseudomonadales bacterium]|nr:DNA-processing protein DprA [Pseudomonadales bacterium]